ncbi:MAG: NAD-dependent epimerase/dehydratase family protein, partial [Clostridia bacterium]
DIDSIKSVFIYERPEIVIYAKTEVTDNVPESRKKVAEVSELSRLSSEYQALKFIYISSTNVYSAKDSTDENDMPHPQTLDAKTNLLCENSLVAYRTDKDLFNVVLRMSDICGEYEYSNAPSVLSRMIAEAIKIGTITTGLNREHALLYVGDAVDAVYRSISDNVDGIYNISPKTAISGPVLAETIYSECQCENPIVGSTFEIQHIVLPPSEKARNEIGFIELSDTQKLVQKTIEWYKTEKVKPKKASGKKRKFPAILTFVESAVVFALLAWLEFILGDASVLNSINLLFLYIIFASVYGGISHGIFAAILVSLYNIFEIFTN